MRGVALLTGQKLQNDTNYGEITEDSTREDKRCLHKNETNTNKKPVEMLEIECNA